MTGAQVRAVRTSPRLPGLLTPAAWRALSDARRVCAPGPSDDVAAVREAGIDVQLDPQPAGGDVWLVTDETVREWRGQGIEVDVVDGTRESAGSALVEFVEVMDTLRRRCPWDAEQTHESLARYLVEETYELVEAIDLLDGSVQAREHLCEELGDVMLQVLFHARIAAEQPDGFDIDDVASGVVTKLVRRHPHVFSDVEVSGAGDVQANWEKIKDDEKRREHPLDGIPPGLPALALADKVVARALRSDLRLSIPVPDETRYDAATLGEVLFALVAAGTAAGIDPEQALRQRVQRELRDTGSG